MLHALDQKKGRRQLLERGLDEGTTFSGNEDLLTSAIFSCLGYLADSTLAEVLMRAAVMDVSHFGSLVAIRFWPRLEFEDRCVIPDVWLDFTNGHLVVEAKRWDGYRMQLPEQLRTQFRASKYYAKGLPVWQLAIGGHSEVASEAARMRVVADLKTSHDQEVYVSDWQALEHAVTSVAPITTAERRVLADLQLALRLHRVNFKAPITLSQLRSEHIGKHSILGNLTR